MFTLYEYQGTLDKTSEFADANSLYNYRTKSLYGSNPTSVIKLCK